MDSKFKMEKKNTKKPIQNEKLSNNDIIEKKLVLSNIYENIIYEKEKSEYDIFFFQEDRSNNIKTINEIKLFNREDPILNIYSEEKNEIIDKNNSSIFEDTINKLFNKKEENKLENKMKINKNDNLYEKRRRGSSGITESEYFRKIRTENSCKLRKEILKIQNRADKYIEKFITISRNFNHLKKNICRKNDNIIKSLISFFGFNFRIIFKKQNFFLLAVKAWIIEIFNVFDDYMISHIGTFYDKNEIDQKIENRRSSILNDNDITNKEKILSENFLDKELLFIDYPKNFTFSSLIKKLKVLEISQESFLKNLSILTGTIYGKSNSCSTTQIIEKSIGISFLNSLKETLDKYEITQEHEDEELDQKKFESLFMNILMKAVEKSLNSMNADIFKNDLMQKNNKKNYKIYDVKYLECYEKLREESKENKTDFNLKKYIKKLIKDNNYIVIKNYQMKYSLNEIYHIERKEENKIHKIKNEIINKDFSIKICAESFFDFSSFKISNIIDEIKVFVREHDSFLYRSKNSLGRSIKNIYDFNKNNLNYFKSTISLLIKNINDKLNIGEGTIENLYKYYYKRFPNTFKNLEERKENFIKSYDLCKNWVNTSCNNIKNKGKNVYEENIIKKYKIIWEKTFYPILDINYKFSNNLINIGSINLKIFSDFLISCKNKINKNLCLIKRIIEFLFKSIFNYSIEFLDLKEKIKILNETNMEKFVLFNNIENNESLKFKLNKKFIANFLNYSKFYSKELIVLFFNLYKNTLKKILSLPSDILKYSFDKTDNIKDYLKEVMEDISKIE